MFRLLMIQFLALNEDHRMDPGSQKRNRYSRSTSFVSLM